MMLVTLVLSTLCLLRSLEAQMCDTVKQYVNGTPIVWPLTGASSISVPPCLDENLVFIRRKCKKGKWEPEPQCHQIMETTEPSCPKGYSQLDSICYKILPGNFSTNCPLPNELPFFEIVDQLPNITTDPVWYPIKRTDQGIFLGEYHHLDKTHNYGTIFDGIVESGGQIKGKGCVVGDSTKPLKLAHCGETFKKICAYSILDSGGICKRKFPGKECFQIFSGDTNECVCILEETHKSRGEFCEKLAEFVEPYQNQMRRLLGDKPCWFGLEKVNSTYIWSSTTKKIHYAFWYTGMTDFTPNYGAIFKNGWLLRSDASTPSKNCALCQETLTYNTPKMEITTGDNQTIILTITFGEDLKNFDGNLNHVCFFEAGSKQMWEKIPTEGVSGDGKTHRFGVAQDGPGFYWCEGFSYPNLHKVVSNKLLVHPDGFGEEFVANITFGYGPNENPLNGAFFHNLRDTILDKMNLGYVSNVRKFKSIDLDEIERNITFLVHVTTNSTKSSGDFREIHEKLKGVLSEVGARLNGFASGNFCPRQSEDFLTWPITGVCQRAFPIESCVQKDGHLVNRKCEGDFLSGAKWGPIIGSCEYPVPVSSVTHDLMDLLEGNHTSETIIENLQLISERSNEFNYTDVFLVGKILHKIGVGDLSNISTIISNVMEVDRKILVQSQLHLNATDAILKTYDDILRFGISPVVTKPYELTITKNLVCLIADVTKSNIIGLVLSPSNGEVVFEPITTDTNLEELLQSTFDTAVLINQKLLYQIKQHLIISGFLHDSLFNPNGDPEKTPENTIFGVLLPGLPKNQKFEAPLSIYYRRRKPKKLPRFCTHWEFTPGVFRYSSTSTWVESGVVTQQRSLVRCDFWHVTHFGLLVATKTSLGDFEILSIITSTNCAISTVGLVVIFVTSILFRSWRLKSSNQILVNFSLAVTLQVGAFYCGSLIFGRRETDERVCIVVGVVLHYSVVAEFCWMLILGLAQFRRLVVVFVYNTKRTILWYCAFGWVVPLVPVLVLLGVSPMNYVQNNDLCYPSHFGFYFAVLLPILVVLTINFSVFVVITYKIFLDGPKCFGGAKGDVFVQLRMLVLLFFMLGLTWLFGLVTHFGGGAFFLYCFCFLATLQGFVLFVFFIVLNKTTRRFYKNLFITKIGGPRRIYS